MRIYSTSSQLAGFFSYLTSTHVRKETHKIFFFSRIMAETMIDEISASVITETGVQNDDEETWTYRSMKK